MTKIDKTDIDNIKLIIKETKIGSLSHFKIKKGDYEIEISSQLLNTPNIIPEIKTQSLQKNSEEANKVENIKLHGSSKNRGGVISFTLKDIHSLDLAQFLNEDNIAVRVGHHCAQPLLNKLGETSTARISFYLYNDDSDISKLCKTLKKVQSYF